MVQVNAVTYFTYSNKFAVVEQESKSEFFVLVAIINNISYYPQSKK